jgi:hypothetical protein
LQQFNADLEKENMKNRYLAKKIRKPVMELKETMKDDELDEEDERIEALVRILCIVRRLIRQG